MDTMIALHMANLVLTCGIPYGPPNTSRSSSRVHIKKQPLSITGCGSK